MASAKDLKAKQGDNVCLFVIIFVPLSVCWFVVYTPIPPTSSVYGCLKTVTA